MRISEIVSFLNQWAHPSLQESYDNSGLLTGDASWECSSALVTLDCTEEIVAEAIEKKCNLIIAHHPIIFKGLKKINGRNYVERTVISAIKSDIAIFAMHTNLDSVLSGVSGKMAGLLGLDNVRILSPVASNLCRLSVYVPRNSVQSVTDAMFSAGAGELGNYSECSFRSEGTGTFKPEKGADPYVGEVGERHEEDELKVELVFPVYMKEKVISAMKKAHPYEEVAYGVFQMMNGRGDTGFGVIGELTEAIDENSFLMQLSNTFKIPCIRHTPHTGKPIKKVAVCGGAGSFLIQQAIAGGADAYVTADLKYHEFFDADGRILVADIGHFESEQFTIDLIIDKLTENFRNFAVLKTEVCTNPVRYFTGTQV